MRLDVSAFFHFVEVAQVRTRALLLAAVLMILGAPLAGAATSANAQSPLGMNLNAMGYFSPEQPFLNIFKTTAITASNNTWTSWSMRTIGGMSQQNVKPTMDANGYPTSLPSGIQACTLVLGGLSASNAGTGPYYRSGQYVVLYDGAGTTWYSNDASIVSQSPGRDVINVANPSAGGIWVCIQQTDPQHTGNNVRNIRMVKAEEESLLTSGGVFEPNFLSLMSRFKVLRAMQWLNIDDSPTPPGNWANRSQVTDAGWGGPNGVPYEVIIQLCNATGADCWLNVPHTADNNFITQLATLAHNSINPTQKVYIEFSNEVWNTNYPQNQYATQQGQALWPGSDSGDANRSWYGMRTAQTCDIWKSVWGSDASRVVCVLGAQGANPWTATTSLNCSLWTGSGNAPCAKHGISAVAIAPYIGWGVYQSSMEPGSEGLSALFSAMTSSVTSVSAQEAAYKTALAPYNLPFIAYEGGQTLVGFPGAQNGSSEVNLFIQANRDSRMGAAYTQALNDWKSNGGELYVIYDDIYTPSMYGEWGALESFMDTVSPLSSAPPKWQAIQNFISANPCWWSGCGGNTAAVPSAPTNLHVTN